MLKRLHVKNFTVFEDADFHFGPGLNVIVGTNGTGKSHVLKLGYAVLWTASRLQYSGPRKVTEFGTPNGTRAVWGEHNWSDRLTKKLKAVFQPDPYELVALVRKQSDETTAELSATFGQTEIANLTSRILPVAANEFELTVDHISEKNLNVSVGTAAFLPPKEVLTMPWLLSMYDSRVIPFDETYPDLLRQLNQPPLRDSESVANELKFLEQLLDGKVEEKGGRFYLVFGKERLEMNLVAEGYRKFATLYKLLANGGLTAESTLFWDEPEANLNPALIKKLAEILVLLARQGFQIILATHSLFLLKELHILAQQQPTPVKYFGLNTPQAGGPTEVQWTDSFPLLPDIVALDAEIDQAEEFLDVLNRDDADF